MRLITQDDIAKKLGCQLNAAASSSSQHRECARVAPETSALGWLNCWDAPQSLDQANEYALYWKGAKATATHYGYTLEEFVIGKELTWDRVDQMLQARSITGILLPPHPNEIKFRGFAWDRYSVVRFGNPIPFPAANIVTEDQFQNMLLIYHEVLKRGYKRIGMVNVNQVNASWINFDSGYMKAQAIHSPKHHIPIFYSNPKDSASNLSQFKKWITQEQPDAIISATTGVSSLLNAAGYQIGLDVGLATTSILDTTIDAGIDQHSDEVGSIAARNVIAQIQDNDFGIPTIKLQTLITGEWVDGTTLPNREGCCSGSEGS